MEGLNIVLIIFLVLAILHIAAGAISTAMYNTAPEDEQEEWPRVEWGIVPLAMGIVLSLAVIVVLWMYNTTSGQKTASYLEKGGKKVYRMSAESFDKLRNSGLGDIASDMYKNAQMGLM